MRGGRLAAYHRDRSTGRPMTVNLTRIYTKLGDGGETHLGDMSRVSKLHPRVEAYGTVDELNATIGVALLAARAARRASREWLRRVQNDLLDVGADLSVPAPAAGRRRRRRGARARCASTPTTPSGSSRPATRSTRSSQPLRSFVIPGGTPAAAHLHVCRTVCRRAERRAIAVGEDGNPEVVRYLNRLSDLLFILSRAANDGGASGAPSRCGSPGAHGAGAPAPRRR